MLGGPLGCRPLWTEPSLNSFKVSWLYTNRRVHDPLVSGYTFALDDPLDHSSYIMPLLALGSMTYWIQAHVWSRVRGLVRCK